MPGRFVESLRPHTTSPREPTWGTTPSSVAGVCPCQQGGCGDRGEGLFLAQSTVRMASDFGLTGIPQLYRGSEAVHFG